MEYPDFLELRYVNSNATLALHYCGLVGSSRCSNADFQEVLDERPPVGQDCLVRAGGGKSYPRSEVVVAAQAFRIGTGEGREDSCLVAICQAA